MTRWLRFLFSTTLGLGLMAGSPARSDTSADPVSIHLFGYDRKNHEVILDADGPLTNRPFHLSNPERWVVDFPGSVYFGATTTLPAISGTPVRSIRIRQNEAVGGVRLVFDLSRTTEFTLVTRPLPGKRLRHAFLIELPAEEPPAASIKPRSNPVANRNEEKRPERSPIPAFKAPPGLTLRRVRNGWQLIVVTATPFTSVISGRKRAERLTVDLVGAGGELPRDSLYVDNGLIARVRIVPLSAMTHRLILEIDRSIEVNVRHMEGTRQLVLMLGTAAEDLPESDTPQSRNHVTRDTAQDAQRESRPPTLTTNRPSLRQESPAPEATGPRVSRARVTLDPGHGGDDPGAIGTRGTREKDVTLKMAVRLQKLMQDSGMDVMMTRSRDMQIHLHPRVDLGNAFQSDVFISIHANHTDDPDISGIETYYFQPSSLPLARAVHRRLVKVLQRPDRGIRRNNFVVVKYNQMPACLVEIGYLSNPGEERLLTSARYQQKAAEAILSGVKDYLRTHPPGE